MRLVLSSKMFELIQAMLKVHLSIEGENKIKIEKIQNIFQVPVVRYITHMLQAKVLDRLLQQLSPARIPWWTNVELYICNVYACAI